MKVPLLGPVSLTGFQNAWFFLVLLIVLLVIGLYVVQQFARRRRVLRFANMEVLERVAPPRPGKWRHVPTILLAVSLVLLTTAMAGPTSDVRIPLNRAVVMLVIDVSESMASTDVPPNRLDGTLFTRLGYWPLLVALLLGLAIALLSSGRLRRPKRA